MRKQILRGGFAAVGILLLILDSRTALSGAQSALELCLCSVIPSIFPFLVLSGVLTAAISGANLRFLRPMGRLLGIPGGSEGIFLTGILGGYPTGAQAVYQAWRQGQLSKEEARRMLAFCSNAGPSFLFGIIGTKFSQGWMLWLLWGVHILSAMAVAAILPGRSNRQRSISSSPITLTQSLKSAVITMGYICGWVVLFRVILAFLDRWILWLIPIDARVGIYGVLELANGCCSLDLVASPALRFILCSAMLAFGGICVAMQTASVVGELGMGRYLWGKILQTIISLLLSAFLQWLLLPSADRIAISPALFFVSVILILLFVVIARKNKNRGSIPAIIGV